MLLPFSGAIYVTTRNSIYASEYRANDTTLRKMMRVVIKGRWATRRFKDRFGYLGSRRCRSFEEFRVSPLLSYAR